MLKTMLKTFGVVVGSALVFAFVAGLITLGVMIGDVYAGLTALVVGIVVGYPIGVLIGIVLVNKLLHYQGSLVFGILGAILGGVIAYFALQYMIVAAMGPTIGLIGQILVFAGPPLLGTLGYCLRRREEVRMEGEKQTVNMDFCYLLSIRAGVYAECNCDLDAPSRCLSLQTRFLLERSYLK